MTAQTLFASIAALGILVVAFLFLAEALALVLGPWGRRLERRVDLLSDERHYTLYLHPIAALVLSGALGAGVNQAGELGLPGCGGYLIVAGTMAAAFHSMSVVAAEPTRRLPGRVRLRRQLRGQGYLGLMCRGGRGMWRQLGQVRACGISEA